MPEPIVLSWSGGKDGVLALDRLRRDPAYEVVGLLTTVTLGDRRVHMHGVPVELIQAQAAALGLPCVLGEVPEFPSNRVYEECFTQAVQRFRSLGVQTIAFGDLFLSDIRSFREELCQRLGLTALFPVWGLDTTELAHEFITRGYEAVVCCVDGRALPAEFAGRNYDAAFLNELPAGVDPCGERGEFHTLVTHGPGFAQRVDFERGEIVAREPFWYCELTSIHGELSKVNVQKSSRLRDRKYAVVG